MLIFYTQFTVEIRLGRMAGFIVVVMMLMIQIQIVKENYFANLILTDVRVLQDSKERIATQVIHINNVYMTVLKSSQKSNFGYS